MKNNIYYKLIAVFCVLSIFLSNVFAAGVYEPGITGEETAKKGEFNYKEVVFLSGEPILLSGTAKITESKTSTGSKTTLEYKLVNIAEDAVLNRKVIYINTDTKSQYDNQIIRSTTIDPKPQETVQIGGDTFTLTAQQYSKSGLTDDKTIIRYNRYDWNGKKTYTRSGGGEGVVDITALERDRNLFDQQYLDLQIQGCWCRYFCSLQRSGWNSRVCRVKLFCQEHGIYAQ